MPEKKRIMGISGLSQSIAEALKEISSCGKSLTIANLNRALSHRKEITELLEYANKSPHDTPVTASELDALKSQIETVENRRKEALRQMAELEHGIARERELFRRLSNTLINMAESHQGPDAPGGCGRKKTSREGHERFRCLRRIGGEITIRSGREGNTGGGTQPAQE